MNSPFGYLGGKSRLADRIVERLPSDHLCYCEPFCGAAWILFRKAPSKVEVINDMDGELVTFWRVIQNHLEEFLRFYRYAIVSRTIFDLQNMTDPRTLTDVQRSVRYFYIQRLAFGGKTFDRTFGTSATSGSKLNISTLEDRLLEVHWRLQKVVVEHLDACDCITRYDRPTTLFYADPPYYGTCGYAVSWGEADYERLRKTMAGIQGRFILSLNDVAAVRDIFKEFRIRKISTRYQVANGRGEKAGRHEDRSELLIDNLK